MKNKRLIARLDIKNNAVVKGINMEGLRVIGSPNILAQHYYGMGIDEILYVDVVASLYDRNSLDDLVRLASKNIFIPLCVGGGIRNLYDVDRMLSNGADKITLNTAAVKNISFIGEVVSKYGSSTVVSAIETLKIENNYYVFTDNGREYTGIEVREWIKRVQEQGAGEILLSCISRDGTGEGFNLDLIHSISDLIEVPLVVHGGAGCVEDIVKVLDCEIVDGACVSSILHYNPEALCLANPEGLEGNTEFKNSGRRTSLTETASVPDIKTKINSYGYCLR